MEKHCEFCGEVLQGYSRSTRKYCSDNCKQLAFYSRQGMNWGKAALAGTTAKGEAFNVKLDLSLNDMREDQQRKEEPGNPPPASEQQQNGENIFNVEAGFTLSGAPEEQPEISQPIDAPASDDPQQDSAVNESSVKGEDEKQDSVKPEEEKAIPEKQERPKYHWVQSQLLEKIESIRQTSWLEIMLAKSRSYWSWSEIEAVQWVTVRIRCLIDNILRLSNAQRISRATLQRIAQAFDAMVNASKFKSLPSNYPLTKLITELHGKFTTMAKNAREKRITLRLSFYRKAELLAVRFMIGRFVPRMRFSELEFGDRQKEDDEKTQGKVR